MSKEAKAWQMKMNQRRFFTEVAPLSPGGVVVGNDLPLMQKLFLSMER